MTRRVLLIEDEPHIAEAIRYILSRDGWAVASHADGIGALDVIRREAPDVVVLDVMLPNRSGFDVLRDLRARGPKPPVLMLTAKGQAQDRATAVALGADIFMTKPFSNAEVVQAVKTLAAT